MSLALIKNFLVGAVGAATGMYNAQSKETKQQVQQWWTAAKTQKEALGMAELAGLTSNVPVFIPSEKLDDTPWKPVWYPDTGISDMSYWDMNNYFNLSALPSYNMIPEALIGHVYMTRPNLNLTEANMENLKSLPTTSGLLTNDFDKNSYMMLGSNSKTNWLPIITNRIKNYTVNDQELKSVEKGATYYGHNVKYAQHDEDHKHGGTISLEFRNDSYHSILKLMWFWVMYMYYVSLEDYLEIDFDNLWYGKLDYDASIFFILTKRDGREIVYFEELVGVHPRRIPISMFSWNDKHVVNETVTIDFDYSIRRDPLDTGMFGDINCLTLGNATGSGAKIIQRTATGTMTRNDIYSSGPVIIKGINSLGENAFFLEHANTPKRASQGNNDYRVVEAK